MATIAWEPSPPAIASASAPPATASRTSVSRSSPGQLHRLDAPAPRLVREVEALRLPASRTRVVQQHRPLRRRRRRQSTCMRNARRPPDPADHAARMMRFSEHVLDHGQDDGPGEQQRRRPGRRSAPPAGDRRPPGRHRARRGRPGRAASGNRTTRATTRPRPAKPPRAQAPLRPRRAGRLSAASRSRCEAGGARTPRHHLVGVTPGPSLRRRDPVRGEDPPSGMGASLPPPYRDRRKRCARGRTLMEVFHVVRRCNPRLHPGAGRVSTPTTRTTGPTAG